MIKTSFRQLFLEAVNKYLAEADNRIATIPTISGDDTYNVKDQIALVKDNPDIITRMNNADYLVIDTVSKLWDKIPEDQKENILNSDYGDQILELVNTRKRKNKLVNDALNNWENIETRDKLNAMFTGGHKFFDQLSQRYPEEWKNNLSAAKERKKQQILAAKELHKQNKDTLEKKHKAKSIALNDTKKKPTIYADKVRSIAQQIQILRDNPARIAYMTNPSKAAIDFFKYKINNGYKLEKTNDEDKDKKLNYYVNVNSDLIDYSKSQPQYDLLNNTNSKAHSYEKYSMKDMGKNKSINLIKSNPYAILDFIDANTELKAQAISEDPSLIIDLLHNNQKVNEKLLTQAVIYNPRLYLWLESNKIDLPYNYKLNIINYRPQLIKLMKNPEENLVKLALLRRPSLYAILTDEEIPDNLKELAKTSYNQLNSKTKDKLEDEDAELIYIYKKPYSYIDNYDADDGDDEYVDDYDEVDFDDDTYDAEITNEPDNDLTDDEYEAHRKDFYSQLL